MNKGPKLLMLWCDMDHYQTFKGHYGTKQYDQVSKNSDQNCLTEDFVGCDILNKLGRGPLRDATYQISRL